MWQVACIEAFDLLDARSGILGKIEDVHLPIRENDPHANRSMAKTVDCALSPQDRIHLQLRFFQQGVELSCDDARCGGSVRVVRRKM